MKYSNQNIIEQYEKENESLKYIFFWGHQPNKDGSIGKSCFSQWWQSDFKVDNVVYKTAEHFMMAEKARLFNDEDIFEKIINTNHPNEVKKLGRKVKNFNPEQWDDSKFGIVKAANFYKFSQTPELKKFLLSTGNRIIVEASPVDAIWGIGMAKNDAGIENPNNWKGENLLGYALMEVRDELK